MTSVEQHSGQVVHDSCAAPNCQEFETNANAGCLETRRSRSSTSGGRPLLFTFYLVDSDVLMKTRL
jgi:hypothetical protein